MPSLVANGRAIARAIKGSPAMYEITRHDRLYLDVRGEGRAAWRICYQPKPNANQRWFTLADAATHADFEEVARSTPRRRRRHQHGGPWPTAFSCGSIIQATAASNL